MFTPPIVKSKNNVFFNSDDSLYKSEMKKLTIPEISVERAPVFKLEITDFSDPTPKSLTIKNPNSQLVKQHNIDEDHIASNSHFKSAEFKQSKSVSLDTSEVDNLYILNDNDHLNVGGRKLNQCKFSSSLQELSSSTSSINSGIHESTLDLTQIDPNTPIKHWKSPDDLREGKVKTLAQHFEQLLNFKHHKLTSFSEPNLNKCTCDTLKLRSLSDEHLDVNSKLTEYERMEVLKVLCDWSLQGCEAKNDANFSLKIIKEFRNLESKSQKRIVNSNLTKCCLKYKSEPNLSPKIQSKALPKSTSVDNLGSKKIADSDFLHDCKFTNCIFNKNFIPSRGTKENFRLVNQVAKPKPLKGILKNSNECLNSVSNPIKVQTVCKPNFLNIKGRRHSDISLSRPFNSQLLRRGSLERLTYFERKGSDRKKFPESYIVTNNSSRIKPVKVVVHKKCLPKTWKSCSDIKGKQKVIKKCCKNANHTCPLLKDSSDIKRNTKSCAEIDLQSLEFAARVAALKDMRLSDYNCKKDLDVHNIFFALIQCNRLCLCFFDIFLFLPSLMFQASTVRSQCFRLIVTMLQL
uniref:Uncharacterized protein n=1 Tax=Photinus pyralis TaxID=7054 RepID=A0A1Y1LQS6_PHOPY